MFCFGLMQVDLYWTHAILNAFCVVIGFKVYLGFCETGIYGIALYAVKNSFLLFACSRDKSKINGGHEFPCTWHVPPLAPPIHACPCGLWDDIMFGLVLTPFQ